MLWQDDTIDHGRETAADAALGQTADCVVQLFVGVFREVGLGCGGLSQLLGEGDAEWSGLLGKCLA